MMGIPVEHPEQNPSAFIAMRLALGLDNASLYAIIEAFILSLPTTLPAEPNKLWLNGGVLSVSS